RRGCPVGTGSPASRSLRGGSERRNRSACRCLLDDLSSDSETDVCRYLTAPRRGKQRPAVRIFPIGRLPFLSIRIPFPLSLNSSSSPRRSITQTSPRHPDEPPDRPN